MPTKSLLNVDANAKTVKGQKKGFLTGVMYLAPYKGSGRNVCPLAELAGCAAGCLNVAGRGGISKGGATFATPAGPLPDNAIQRARINRTNSLFDDRAAFMARLVGEIEALIRKAERKGLTPVVRLNGTSDIQWEVGHPVTRDGVEYASIFDAFPRLTFYDYTKIAKRFGRPRRENYHLTLSYSAASSDYAEQCIEAHANGAPLAVVARDVDAKNGDAIAAIAHGPIVDGDENDLRFLDPDGACVVLKAKGRARRDTSGFVID